MLTETIALAVIFLLGFGFPIWVAALTYKKGRKTFAIVIFITTFIGVGWLLAVFALMLPASFPEHELDEPCPECGNTLGFSYDEYVDRKTGQPILGFIQMLLFACIAILLIGGGIAIAISVWSEGDGGMIQWDYGSTVAGFGFLVLGIAFGRPFAAGVFEYWMADRTQTTMYKCNECDNLWNEFASRVNAPDEELSEQKQVTAT